MIKESPEATACVELPSSPSAFDAHDPPSPEIIGKCVHCGFCLQTCPTYVLGGREMDSPRGRIQLMKMASEGTTAITSTWVGHFDSCLGCMACSTACPSGVDYGSLIEATRAQIERLHKRSFVDKLYRQVLFSVLTRPDRLRLLRWPLLLYQGSGLQALVRKTGILKLLPQRLQAMEALTPRLTESETIQEVMPAHGEARGRVGMLLGCVQREFLSQVNAATARVLAAEGCEVIAPKGQPCCGALLLHAGEERAAAELARQMIDVFERAEVETIVINSGGCGSSMKEYGHLLRDDPKYEERARRFSAKCKDVSELLEQIVPRAVRHPLPMRVAYLDSCHLQHAQGVRSQPRTLLRSIPSLELVEVPEASICCGSAGIYNLVQPEAGRALGERKAELIVSLAADVVATGNPGCIVQMATALSRSGRATQVVHTIQLLDASVRGLSPEYFPGLAKRSSPGK